MRLSFYSESHKHSFAIGWKMLWKKVLFLPGALSQLVHKKQRLRSPRLSQYHILSLCPLKEERKEGKERNREGKEEKSRKEEKEERKEERKQGEK